MSKLASPYRSRSGSPSESEGERKVATLALRATTLQVEDFNHPTATQLALWTGVAIVLGVSLAFEAALGWLLLAAAVIFVMRKRREITMSSVVVVIENGKLALVRPGLDASVPLRELRSVGLAEEDEPGFAVVGHGLRAATLATSRGRAHIVFRTADRATPLLTLPISQSECFEWIPKIRAFLKANGWSPEDAALVSRVGEDERDHEPSNDDQDDQDDD